MSSAPSNRVPIWAVVVSLAGHVLTATGVLILPPMGTLAPSVRVGGPVDEPMVYADLAAWPDPAETVPTTNPSSAAVEPPPTPPVTPLLPVPVPFEVDLGKDDGVKDKKNWISSAQPGEHGAPLASTEQPFLRKTVEAGAPASASGVDAPASNPSPDVKAASPMPAPSAETAQSAAVAPKAAEKSPLPSVEPPPSPPPPPPPPPVVPDLTAPPVKQPEQAKAAEPPPEPVGKKELLAGGGQAAAPSPPADGPPSETLPPFVQPEKVEAPKEKPEEKTTEDAKKVEPQATPPVQEAAPTPEPVPQPVAAPPARPERVVEPLRVAAPTEPATAQATPDSIAELLARLKPDAASGAQPSEPAPASTPGTAGAKAGKGGDAPQSEEAAWLADKESDPTSTRRTAKFQSGRVDAGEGLEIVTINPRFGPTVRNLTSPRSPVFEVKFDRKGGVKKIRMLKSSGYEDVNEPVKNALFQWRAKGRVLEELPAQYDGIILRITIILNG